jgi:3',5'-cyclic AMP phosphodiesterase CpdA
MKKLIVNCVVTCGVLLSMFFPSWATSGFADESVQTSRQDTAKLYVPPESESFAFLVFGDRTSGKPEGISVLKDAVVEANRITPDFVMTVGDLVQGYNTEKQWVEQMKEFKSVMGELDCPWFPAAGNHDIYGIIDKETKKRTGNDKLYEKYFGPLWYAFEYKNYQFIVLFTDEGDPQTGEKTYKKPEGQIMSDAQWKWLESVLEKATKADGIFVFLHHPRWLDENDVGYQYGADWTRIHQALVKAGNVKAVFGGHIHRITDKEKDGIRYMTLAPTGGNLRELNPEAGMLQEFHHVTVRKNRNPKITVFTIHSTVDTIKPRASGNTQQNEPPKENIPIIAP